MGYTENSCQICAVSLNIARLRTKHEPPEAGWGYSSDTYYSGVGIDSLCSILAEQSGCENIDPSHEEGYEGSDELHLPGRGCTFDGGYNGWKITAEEMKGMRLPRYIVRKPSNGEFDDEEQTDYERASDYFITSQTTEPPDDFEPGTLAQVRFGIDDFYPQNYCVVEADEDQTVGVPVHDSCWKIFERVSTLRLGGVDLQGFMALWNRQACGTCGFQGLEQDPLIQICKEQFWTHKPGTEYFGANPYDIPRLMLALHSDHMGIPEGDAIFSDTVASKESSENSTDKFRVLPSELQTMILSHLSSRDIAALRLVSRSFRILSKRLFRHLIQKELPWFWEFDDLIDLNRKYILDRCPENSKAKERKRAENVNWYVVYNQLLASRSGVLGVKNRVRVWNMAEAIVERIARLRSGAGEGEELEADPTDKEREEGQVKNDLYCLRCDPKLGLGFW